MPSHNIRMISDADRMRIISYWFLTISYKVVAIIAIEYKDRIDYSNLLVTSRKGDFTH